MTTEHEDLELGRIAEEVEAATGLARLLKAGEILSFRQLLISAAGA